MGEKTLIRISRDLLPFIKETAEQLKSQDNRHTDTPIFRIYEVKKVERRDGCGEFTERLTYEGAEEYYCRSCRKILEDNDYDFDKLPEIGEEACSCDCIDDAHWTFDKKLLPADDGAYSGVGFLTEKAAQEYLQANSYHFNQGVVYAESAFRNWELRNIIRLIEELGEDII